MTSREYWERRAARDIFERMETAEKTSKYMNSQIKAASEYIESEVKKVFRGMEGFGISEAFARRIINSAHDKSALQRLRHIAERVTDEKQRGALLDAIDSAGAYRYRVDRLEELNRQINERCAELYKTENRAVTSALKTVAEDSYYHSIFNLQKQTGLAFSFAQFSEKNINKILRAHWNGANYSQRIWKDLDTLADSLKDELLISMLTGRSGDKTARIIADKFGTNMYCARRIVRTESAYVASAAAMDAYEEADVKKYRFVAVLDNRTCDCCAELDGKEFLVSEAQPGLNCNPMHPFCRSTTINADIDVSKLERRAKDENGNTIKVPASMTYKEWAEKYRPDWKPKTEQAEKKGVDKSGESGIIKEIKQSGIIGEIHYPAKSIDVSALSVNTQHIAERGRNINADEAKSFIKDAKFSVSKWNGAFENYYSQKGAAFVDVKNNEIRTAFKRESYDEKAQKAIEVFKDD